MPRPGINARRLRPEHLPRWLRPKLHRDQQRDLAMAHIVNLDALASGKADETILWQWVGGALTWSGIAVALASSNEALYSEAVIAMTDQMAVCTAVIQRYGATGWVALQGDEYGRARDACEWMDALAEVVDRATAIAAADASEKAIEKMAAKYAAPAEGVQP